jgi:flagellar biosynthesis/type III secretory pathway protein FliH
MTRIIKASATSAKSHNIRPLEKVFGEIGVLSAFEAPPGDGPADDGQGHASDALNAKIAALELQLGTMRKRIEDARQSGYETGYSAAKVERDLQIERLDTALSRAQSAWESALCDLEPVALRISEQTLNRVIGEADDWSPLVLRSTRAALDRLKDHVDICVELSAHDFDPADIDQIALTLSRGRGHITFSTEREAGSCLITGAFGNRLVGPIDQWREIKRVLAEILRDAE